MTIRYRLSGPRLFNASLGPRQMRAGSCIHWRAWARLGFVLAVVSGSANSVEGQVAGPTKSQCIMACIGKFKDCEFRAKCWSSTACEALKQLRGEGTEKERLKKCHADHLECLGPCAANIWR